MDKVLIICGPTATGKTDFALQIAQKYSGELVSADSRQVYQGKDIITGKDLPPDSRWTGSNPGYYDLGYTRIWLYDVISSREEFSVALWNQLANQVISNILSRRKLPIVVGGTGLYLKSLTQHLTNIFAPRNLQLRKKMQTKDAQYLFNYLWQLSPSHAEKLNDSDQHNPRRLIRAIEIALSETKDHNDKNPTNYDFLQIGLTSSKAELYRRVDKRVDKRLAMGASREDPVLAANPGLWRSLEHKIVRLQLTWFAKQTYITWFDITHPGWQKEAQKRIEKWYNSKDATQD